MCKHQQKFTRDAQTFSELWSNSNYSTGYTVSFNIYSWCPLDVMDKHCNHTEELYKRQELQVLYQVLFLTLASTWLVTKLKWLAISSLDMRHRLNFFIRHIIDIFGYMHTLSCRCTYNAVVVHWIQTNLDLVDHFTHECRQFNYHSRLFSAQLC